MDERGESSSSYNFSPNEFVHAPVTPDKLGWPDANMIKNWLENPFREAGFEQRSVMNSFSCWDGGFGSTSQSYEIAGGMCGKFSVDDVETWNSISCRDLLALADATIGKGGGGWMNLCDFNTLPPQTVVDPLISMGLSLQFTPLTPDQAKRVSDKDVSTLVEADRESAKGLAEQTNLNETPQPKPKRRKHRPKVVTEGKPKRARKPTTPKPATPNPDGSSTGKRKYVRRKGVEKSTATPAVEETNGVVHPSPDQQTKKTCKRKIDFDESEKQAEEMVDKACPVTSEVVENYQKVHETESPSLITPSKTELPQGRLKRKYTKAKCKINFLQETHDNGPGHVPGPNEPDCSTSVRNKKKSNAPETSKKKKIMAPSLYHAHLGYNPNLRRESIYNIDALSSRFERLHINTDALVPYMSRYHEKNALVVYQQDTTLVPYEGLFNPMKKRRQRPKVDLDDETNRVWMLLLENINSKGIDGTDEDKAKWWEEERRVFRGRVDSFIARMHLIQGDRRFSQWKGSVLDSVVGVFLTQNVSDHLSSSAFMSLAARYPIKLNTSGEPLHEEESILSVKEPCQVDESGDRGRVMLQEADSCDSKEVVNSNEFSKNCVVSVDLNDGSECEVAELSEKESVINHIEVEEIVSSQNSADTCSTHKTEEQNDRCKAASGGYTSFVELLHMQGPSACESETIQKNSEKCVSEESGISAESASQTTVQMVNTISSQESANSNCTVQQVLEITNSSIETSKASRTNNIVEALGETVQKVVDFHLNKNGNDQIVNGMDEGSSKAKKEKTGKTQSKVEWDELRLQAEVEQKRERTPNTVDSMDYEAIRAADVNDVADAIKERGMNNRLAARIKDMLDRLVKDHGSLDLEWLRDVPPDKAKEYLLSFKGLGLKSVECIRLLTLHHLAFPVDTNVGRIAVRLGWVPLQPLPESLQLHLLEMYPIQETIQKYLWPRLCKLDQRTLYELHYQMITFGKVFCTKTKPNCNACPLRGECRHFASAFASARLSLPAPEESITGSTEDRTGRNPIPMIDLPSSSEQPKQLSEVHDCNPVVEEQATLGPMVEVPPMLEPIVEVPASPEPEQIQEVFDIEDFGGDAEEIPMIKLNIEALTQNLQTYMERHMELGEGDVSKALVALTSEAASIPTPKLKNISQLRTEHQVYELPDSHPLLEGLDTREHDDPCPYLLAIWTPGETADSIQPPEGQCSSQESGTLCNEETCFFCNSTREANSQTVRGTLLIPCRTAMRGSFPLNGTYFQVNEVFADHKSSLNPIDVPRAWLWNLPRRTVYFGTSIPTIFKGMTTEDIQYCFWKGFVCVRGFEQKTRAPRPLMARLHFPASRLNKPKPKTDEKDKVKQ
ncbi:putative DNA-(apurinic or apyrimidinic site) lyase [Helianthus annuus]|nr:putative DNA-(apurinic or apyrimidinic site) lyase [Helianthus annuus]